MSLTIKYENVAGTLSSIGSNVVRFGSLALTQNADIGQEAMSELGWDDPDGTWTITGYRVFTMSESAAPSNNQQIYRGRVGSRTYSRGPSMRVGTGRRINVELMDQNVLLGWRVMKDQNANRPAETAGDRIRWLVNTRRAPIFAHPTYFANPTTAMDANDYRNQRYNDVLADIANVTGYNFWADYDEGRERTELFFINPNSTDYTSTLSISNTLADIDSTTVFAPGEDTELTRDPSRIAASVLGIYDGGDVYSTRDSTGNFYAFVDQTYELSNIKSAAKALALNTRYLDDNDEEDDRISTSVIVPAASVNLIRQGMRISAKFSHFTNEGYGVATWYRVLKRTVIQDEAIGQDYYRLDLELSPIGPGTVAGNEVYGVFFFRSAVSPVQILPTGWSQIAYIDTDGGISLATGPASGSQTITWTHASAGTNWTEMVVAELGTIDGAGPGTGVTVDDPGFGLTASITVTATGAGMIFAAIRIYNWDSGARTLTKPAGYTTIYERMNTTGAGERDWGAVNVGYLPVASAGSYTLTYTMSNQFNWQKVLAAVFVPTIGTVALAQSANSGPQINNTLSATFPNPL